MDKQITFRVSNRELQNPSALEHYKRMAKRKEIEDLCNEIDMGKSYILTLCEPEVSKDCLCEYDASAYKYRYNLREVPTRDVQIARMVFVDAKTITSINCRNCGAPIPVGKLNSEGSALAECRYCGTYHIVKG